MRRSGGVLLSMILATAAPGWAQTSDRQLGEALLSTARAAPPARPRPRCRGGANGAAGSGDIVVCGANNERIPPTSDTDPGSRAGLRNGELHPPKLGKESCRGQLGCFGAGRVSPPAYIIDMKAIPEAPAGSDADRIAKGEMAQP